MALAVEIAGFGSVASLQKGGRLMR